MTNLDKALEEELGPYVAGPASHVTGPRPPVAHPTKRAQLAPERGTDAEQGQEADEPESDVSAYRRFNEVAIGLCLMLGTHALLRGLEIVISS